MTARLRVGVIGGGWAGCAAAAALMPLLAAAQSAPVAGDPNKGAQKVAMCQGCHGIVGWRTAFPEVYRVPKLSGQSQQYIVLALKASSIIS